MRNALMYVENRIGPVEIGLTDDQIIEVVQYKSRP